MSDFQIDPVKYGQLWEKVDQLSVKVDKLEEGMAELLELAHKGRGGFWVGIGWEWTRLIYWENP